MMEKNIEITIEIVEVDTWSSDDLVIGRSRFQSRLELGFFLLLSHGTAITASELLQLTLQHILR